MCNYVLLEFETDQVEVFKPWEYASNIQIRAFFLLWWLGRRQFLNIYQHTISWNPQFLFLALGLEVTACCGDFDPSLVLQHCHPSTSLSSWENIPASLISLFTTLRHWKAMFIYLCSPVLRADSQLS